MERTSNHAGICIAWPHDLSSLDIEALVLPERLLHRLLEREALMHTRAEHHQPESVIAEVADVRER
jgi:hypothetical protein